MKKVLKKEMVQAYTILIDDCPYKENVCSCGSKQGGWTNEEADRAFKAHTCNTD